MLPHPLHVLHTHACHALVDSSKVPAKGRRPYHHRAEVPHKLTTKCSWIVRLSPRRRFDITLDNMVLTCPLLAPATVHVALTVPPKEVLFTTPADTRVWILHL